jgi:ribonuclease P protein component
MDKPDETFPFRERLRKKKDFDRVYEEGDVFQAEHLVLFCLRQNVPERKAGFVASRKLGDATTRNRARRRLREAYRKLRNRVPETVYLVFVARNGVTDIAWPKLLADMEDALGKAGLLAGK